MTEERTVNQQIAELQGITNIQPEFIGGLRTDNLIGKTKEGYPCRVPDYEGDLNAVLEALPEDYSLEIWTTPDGKPAGMVRRSSQCFYGRDAATRKEAAAKALLAMLTWKAEQGKGEE